MGQQTSFGNTNVFNKNKKKKPKLDLNFFTIKKCPGKDDEPHKRMFGFKNHPLPKKPKVYHWCSYNLNRTVHKKDKCEQGMKMAKIDNTQK